MAILISLALPFFGLVLLGALAEKIFKIEESGLAWLNVFVFYFAVPPLVFKSIANAPFESLLNWTFIGATTISTYIIFVGMFTISLFVFRARMTAAAMQASSASYSNLIYLGIPLAIATFGKDAAVPAALIACFDNIVQFTLVPLIAGLDGTSERPRREIVLTVIRKIFLNPLILASMAGALVSAFDVKLASALDTLLTNLGNAAAPAALFAMGVTVALRPLEGVRLELPVILIAKMVIHPLLVFSMMRMIHDVDPVWAGVAILLAALPTAANVFVLANQYRSYATGVSNAILISTLISVATISTLLSLIDSQYLP